MGNQQQKKRRVVVSWSCIEGDFSVNIEKKWDRGRTYEQKDHGPSLTPMLFGSHRASIHSGLSTALGNHIGALRYWTLVFTASTGTSALALTVSAAASVICLRGKNRDRLETGITDALGPLCFLFPPSANAKLTGAIAGPSEKPSLTKNTAKVMTIRRHRDLVARC